MDQESSSDGNRGRGRAVAGLGEGVNAVHQREAGAKGHVQIQAQASGGITRHLYKARVGELEGNRLRERSMNNLWHVLNLRH